MPNFVATITVKTSAGVRASQLWASLATATSAAVPIKVNAAGKGNVTLTKGTTYFIFWQFHGLPGDTLAFEIKTPAGAKVAELKESKIAPGDAYQAGAREFTA